MKYNFKKIENFWQNYWKKNNTFETNLLDFSKPKYYILGMFPYPSGKGLHIGHIRSYTPTDIIAKFKKMQGYNVLNPMGWDAFGLPAENYAIKTNNHPKTFTDKNITYFKKQLIKSGLTYDWKKEINTSEPKYYKFTQYIFNCLYENNLVVKRKTLVNWCPKLNTVLSNEEIIVKNNKMFSERGEYPVEKKEMFQWLLKITKYSDKLSDSLSSLNWFSEVLEMQKNWIGKKNIYLIKLKVNNFDEFINIPIENIDILNKNCFCIISNNHPLWKKEKFSKLFKSLNFIEKNIIDSKKLLQKKEINAVFTNLFLYNPITNKKFPIFVSDYFDFDDEKINIYESNSKVYKKFIDFYSIKKFFANKDNNLKPLKNKEIISIFKKKNLLLYWKKYNLKDWIFSRQRYWGEPIPIFYSSNETFLEKKLPLELPNLNNFKAKENEKPLDSVKDWKFFNYNNFIAERDTNVMPQWAGSNWYFLAYLMKYHDSFLNFNHPLVKKIFSHWLPVDLYIGGKEHSVLHLLYSRFWTKFLKDIKILNISEPFKKLFNQGMVLDENGLKMSKSKGNIINPDKIIEEYGADTLRLYVMHKAPLEKNLLWSIKALKGSKKWLDRVYILFTKNIYWFKDVSENDIDNNFDKNLIISMNQTIFKVIEYYEKLKFNTIISQLMIFINNCYMYKKIPFLYGKKFLKLLYPIAPHICEELWLKVYKQKNSISLEELPKYNINKINYDIINFNIYKNNKNFYKISIPINLEKTKIFELLLNKNKLIFKPLIENSQNIIFVKNRLLKFIV